MIKQNIYLTLIFVSAVLLSSCEENFSPKTEVANRTFLFSVISADDTPYSSTQFVVINKVYDVDGFDPSTNNTDPTITNAVVTLKIYNKTYTLSLDSVAVNNAYLTKQYFYAINAKVNSYDTLIVTARLADGKGLSSHTRAPKYLNFTYSYPFNHGFTTNLNQVIPVYAWTISWTNSDRQHLLFPKMQISYLQNVNGTSVLKYIDVPNKYITRNGKKEAYYEPYTREEFVSYDFEAVDSTMAKISEGDSDKSNYTILGLSFKLVEYDTPLSNYYSSTNGYLDSYSVRSDESIYSNISGGYGIFGSQFTNSFTKDIDPVYIRSFGYVTQ